MNDVVCVLNPDVKYQLQHYYGVDETSMTTPYDLVNIERQGMKMPTIKENVLLARHPYEQQLFELNEQSEDKIVLERIQKMMTILSYLGAKYCKIKSTSLKLNDKSIDINGSIGIDAPLGSGKVSGESHDDSHSQEAISVAAVGSWPGSYTIKGYQKAKEIAESSGLINDSAIASLIEERNPEHPSPVTARSYSVDVRSDLEKMKQASIELEGKIKKANVGIELAGCYAMKSTEGRHNTFDFEAEFGPLKVSKNEIKDYHSSSEGNKKRKGHWLVIIAVAIVIISVVVWVVLK